MTQAAGGKTHLFAGIGRYHLLVFAACWLGGIFDGMDSTLMSVVLPVSIGELIGTTSKLAVSHVGSIVTAVFLLGWVAGGILFGIMGDKLGRVRSMIVSILLYAIFTGLAAFVHTWPQLAACRFLTGLGIGGELVSICTFLTEVWPARSRALAVGVLITSYQAGVLIAGGVNYIFPSWRTAFMVGALPALLVIFLRMAMRESDEWVAARDRELAANEGKSPSPVRELFQRKHLRSLLVGSFAFGGLLIGYWASLSWIPAWIQDLIGPGIGPERSIATMCQGICAMAGCAVAGIVADRLGRRKTMMLSYTGSFLASALLFLTNKTFSSAIYWQDGLLGFTTGMAQATMYIYLPELFPTLARASGVGFCLNAGRLATAVSVLFVGTLVQLFGGYAAAGLAFSFSYLIAVIAACFGRETAREALPA